MNKRDTEECLKRAKECARQADAAVEPELKIYLMKLGSVLDAGGGRDGRTRVARVVRPSARHKIGRPPVTAIVAPDT